MIINNENEEVCEMLNLMDEIIDMEGFIHDMKNPHFAFRIEVSKRAITDLKIALTRLNNVFDNEVKIYTIKEE